MNRMIVCPMRSKFTNDKIVQTMEEYAYEQDALIHEKFPEWRSSLLDYLIRYCLKTGLSGINIPASMKEWKDDIITNNNEVGDWLNEHIEAGDLTDFVSFVDLKGIYDRDPNIPFGKKLSLKDFVTVAKALFVSRGLVIKDHHRFKDDDGKWTSKRNVILATRLMD